MNIVFCTDKNLIRQAAVLVSSVIHNNQSEDINFYAILLDVAKKKFVL